MTDTLRASPEVLVDAAEVTCDAEVTPANGAARELESLETLQEFVDLDGQCAFLQGVLAEHDWHDTAIAAHFQTLVDEKNDPRLVLGIVGEFSSGKTTLVNALLRADVLETSVTQATTCALTFVHWKSELSAEVVFKDRRPSVRWPPPPMPPPPLPQINGSRGWIEKLIDSIRALFGRKKVIPAAPPPLPQKIPSREDSLRDFLRLYTATEAIAANVLQVNLGYPFPVLRDGLQILDTPGTNAANTRHLEVTAGALQSICHSALVVVPADAPCAQSLMDFVRATLADRMHRCIFLITKLDLLRVKERTRQISYITTVLKRELGLEKITVLAANPRFVIDRLSAAQKHPLPEERSFSEEEVSGFVREYEAAERGIQDHLKRNRLQILLERLLHNMSAIMAGLSELLVTEQKKLQERRTHLENNRIQDLDKFVREQKDFRNHNFGAETQATITMFDEACENLRKDVLNGITSEIAKTTTKDELRSVAMTRPREWLRRYETELQRLVQWFADAAKIQGSAELDAVARDFTTLYKNLTALEASPHINRGLSEAVTGTLLQNSATLTSFSVKVSEKLPENLFLKALDWIFGPKLEELRQQMQGDVRRMMCDVIDEFDQAGEKSKTQIIGDMKSHISEIIDRYSSFYGDTVSAMIAEHRRMESEIAERARRTASLNDEIMRRRQKVERTLAHLISL